MTRKNKHDSSFRQKARGPASMEEELLTIRAGAIAGQIGALIRDMPEVDSSSGSAQAEAAKKAHDKKTVKSVRAIMKDSTVIVNIHMNIDFGKSIPEITRRIQSEVKTFLHHEYPDYALTAVNVWVDGVRFNQDAVRYREEALKTINFFGGPFGCEKA